MTPIISPMFIRRDKNTQSLYCEADDQTNIVIHLRVRAEDDANMERNRSTLCVRYEYNYGDLNSYFTYSVHYTFLTKVVQQRVL